MTSNSILFALSRIVLVLLGIRRTMLAVLFWLLAAVFEVLQIDRIQSQ